MTDQQAAPLTADRIARALVDLEYEPGVFVRDEDSLADFAARLVEAGFVLPYDDQTVCGADCGCSCLDRDRSAPSDGGLDVERLARAYHDAALHFWHRGKRPGDQRTNEPDDRDRVMAARIAAEYLAPTPTPAPASPTRNNGPWYRGPLAPAPAPADLRLDVERLARAMWHPEVVSSEGHTEQDHSLCTTFDEADPEDQQAVLDDASAIAREYAALAATPTPAPADTKRNPCVHGDPCRESMCVEYGRRIPAPAPADLHGPGDDCTCYHRGRVEAALDIMEPAALSDSSAGVEGTRDG